MHVLPWQVKKSAIQTMTQMLFSQHRLIQFDVRTAKVFAGVIEWHLADRNMNSAIFALFRAPGRRAGAAVGPVPVRNGGRAVGLSVRLVRVRLV